MKIVGFAQLHEERRKGNLTSWFESMKRVCDAIYIVDQGSNDGSRDVYERNRAHVTYNPTNDFANELVHKAALLERLKREQPDTDWIFWMDGDTVLDGRLGHWRIRGMLDRVRTGGVKLGHLNLWRSDTHYRVDNKFHALNRAGVDCLWRFWPGMTIESKPGLHGKQVPHISKWTKQGYSLLHRGFASDESIIEKLKTYRAAEGEAVFATAKYQRFLDEDNLELEPVPLECYPPGMAGVRPEAPACSLREAWEAAQ